MPFPVWYSLDAEGEPDYDHPILAAEDTLPIDPSSEVPPGFDESERGQPGGFMADPDVMDTWATSSLSPQIVCGWERDPELFALTFPMDLNTHAHEIIRTWLFSRVVRAHFENHSLPWLRSMISGFVMDPDRKKMSKSKGNVVVPTDVLERYGSDAVRWRAAKARPGMDSPFDEREMKVGRRLALKVLNASKFVLGLGRGRGRLGRRSPSRSISRCWPSLRTVIADATTAPSRRSTTPARWRSPSSSSGSSATTTWNWSRSARTALPRTGAASGAGHARRSRWTCMLRLLAPIMPYATEEVWSWWHDGSIHRASWPRVDETCLSGDPATAGRRGGGPDRDPRRQVPGQGVDEDRGQPRRNSRDRLRRWLTFRRSEPICGPSAGSLVR